ncbi:MAG: ribosome maturation factor RimP [Ruminococcaceae bacterium]|nr:ribosome maturation factor RimP [Oscillospiraceae bacterium]
MKQSVAAKVKPLLEGTILEKGFTLWDITFGKEGGEMLLTVTVDKDEEISLNMLSELNAVINDILDENDPIDGAYSLMLESAGAERPLRTDAHINYAIEKKAHVELKLYKAIDGVKEFGGTIQSADGESVTLKTEKGVYTFDRKAISKLCAYV